MSGINPRLVTEEVFQNLTDSEIDEIVRFVEAIAFIKICGGSGEYKITLEEEEITQESLLCQSANGYELHVNNYAPTIYLISDTGEITQKKKADL